MVKTETLMKIAMFGGFFTAGTGYILRDKLIEKYQRKDYYREALSRLRQSSGAMHVLGEPIRDKRFKITDSKNNFCDGKEARFKVPVAGSRAKGMYYFWAINVNKESEKWVIQRAELELDGEPNRRLVVIKGEQSEYPVAVQLFGE